MSTKSSSTGKGNPWIGATIGEAAMGASKTKTFLGSRYRRIVKRRGKQRALLHVFPAEPDIFPRFHDVENVHPRKLSARVFLHHHGVRTARHR